MLDYQAGYPLHLPWESGNATGVGCDYNRVVTIYRCHQGTLEESMDTMDKFGAWLMETNHGCSHFFLICCGWSIRGRKMDGNLWFYVKCTWLVSLVNNGIQPLISVFMGKSTCYPKQTCMSYIIRDMPINFAAKGQETHLRKQDLTSIPASVL